MPASFQEYWGTQKPKLDEGFRSQMSLLLENIPLRQTASLMATLEAGKKIRGCLVCLISVKQREYKCLQRPEVYYY